MADKPVRTRVAPSPTGDPHVGTAYMALVDVVLARQHGGQFVLRIDDTDRNRYRAGSEQAIFDALRWLGLEWDEGPDKGGPHGPYRQSERTAIYQEHAQLLLEQGKAYRCFCTPEELDAMRARQREAKQTPRYDGTCRARSAEDVEARLAKDEAHVVRLKMPTPDEAESITIQDMFRGPVTYPQDNFQDQVLLKTDGFPTYHLASCVDDHLMGISHIIRAEEWMVSAPIHKVIFEAFGWDLPVLCHMPLLRNPDKSKISKRKNPTSILHYRNAGFLPEAMLNFLGLMGWGGPRHEDGSQQEIFTLDEMVAHYRLENVRLGSPVFDLDKLRHVNATYLRAMTPREYGRAARAYLGLDDEDRLAAIAEQAQPRTETLGEFLGVVDFFMGDVSHWTPETRAYKDPKLRVLVEGLVPKKREAQETWFMLSLVQQRLERVDPWTAENLRPECEALAEEEGWPARDLLMSIRVALTGRQQTPGLWESMEILRKSRCLGRIGDALRAIGEPGKKAKKRWEKARRAKEQGGDS